MKKIAFVAYFFSEGDGVSSLRSRTLAQELEFRRNKLFYYTRDSFGNRARKSKIVYMFFLFFSLMKQDFDLLYVSCGPFWHLRVILLVCILKRKEFIVDFRDPWSINLKTGFGASKEKGKPGKIKRIEFMERRIYSKCKFFWVCTPGMNEAYEKLFGNSEKLRTVLNGHSLPDHYIVSTVQDRSKEKLSFVCLGKFVEYGECRARKVLKKIKHLCEKEGLHYSIDFIGTNMEKTTQLVQELNLACNVKIHPPLPYNQAIEEAKKKDIGLVVLRDEQLEFGTKVFDYIGLGLPIFDCFNRNSNFSKFFKRFFTLTTKKEINVDDRKKFQRRNLFLPYLSDIDDK